MAMETYYIACPDLNFCEPTRYIDVHCIYYIHTNLILQGSGRQICIYLRASDAVVTEYNFDIGQRSMICMSNEYLFEWTTILISFMMQHSFSLMFRCEDIEKNPIIATDCILLV